MITRAEYKDKVRIEEKHENERENRQKLDKAYVDAVANLNNILTKIDQYTGLSKLINEKTNNKNMIPILVIFPVFVKYSSANKKIDNKKDNDDNDDHG